MGFGVVDPCTAGHLFLPPMGHLAPSRQRIEVVAAFG